MSLLLLLLLFDHHVANSLNYLCYIKWNKKCYVYLVW